MHAITRIIRKGIENMQKSPPPELLVLNEAVNFEKQCIYIAVPKTGTTSVRTQLKQHGTPLIKNPHLNIVQVRDSLYVYFLMQALENNKAFPTEAVLSDSDIRIKSRATFDTFFKFSAVRNPWARATSLYSRREGVKTIDKISFKEFCRNHIYASDTCCHPTLHQNQLDWMCDENGLCIMDYVYRLEDFNQAVNEISERTNGRVMLERKNTNRNPNSDSRSYREIYTEETKRMIAMRFEKDIDTFKYTF